MVVCRGRRRSSTHQASARARPGVAEKVANQRGEGAKNGTPRVVSRRRCSKPATVCFANRQRLFYASSTMFTALSTTRPDVPQRRPTREESAVLQLVRAVCEVVAV